MKSFRLVKLFQLIEVSEFKNEILSEPIDFLVTERHLYTDTFNLLLRRGFGTVKDVVVSAEEDLSMILTKDQLEDLKDTLAGLDLQLGMKLCLEEGEQVYKYSRPKL